MWFGEATAGEVASAWLRFSVKVLVGYAQRRALTAGLRYTQRHRKQS